METNSQTYLLRMKHVATRTGLSKPTIYRMIANGEFPKPNKIGERIAFWEESVIEAWIQRTLKACREQAKQEAA